MNDEILLKLAAQIVRKSGSKKYKVRGEIVTSEEVAVSLTKMSEDFEKGRYGRIKRCRTCGNFSSSGKRGARGCCFPKDFTCSKAPTDYCSDWTPMSKEQSEIRRKINEHFKSLQTK